MTFDLRRVREELPAAREAAYFNAGTFGPLPNVAAEAMHAHVAFSTNRGRIGHAGLDRWFGLMDETRDAFARTLHASADDVALMHCTTDGCNAVVWGLPFDAGDEVVTTTHEHPGLTAPLDELARTKGVLVHAREPNLDELLAAVGPRTRLVAVSHVLWTTGHVLPLAELAAAVRAKTNGRAAVLVDGAQSVGAIDVNPAALGVDAYTVSGQKWLCGPSGTGALWVSPSLLNKLGTPWPWYLSKSRSPAGARDWSSARRLDASTIGMTSLAGAVAALAWHQSQVESRAIEHAASLAAQLRHRLAKVPGVAVVPAENPSQLVSFTVSGATAGEASQKLEAAGVLVRPIPGVEYVRASVGFWNDEGDVTRLVDALTDLAAG